MPFFSIILPIYNAKNFLENTLDSILSQSFTDFELLALVDGSNDGSEDIIRRYSVMDSRIVAYFKKNSGICDTRNLGIKLSKGKYLVFCDHDDFMNPLTLELLFDQIQQNKPEVVKYSYKNIVINNEYISKDYIISSDFLLTRSKELKNNYEYFNNFIYTVWNGAYKKSLITDVKQEFDTNIKSGMEDIVFNLQLLNSDFSIQFLPNVLYEHYIRYGQSASRRFDINKLKYICSSIELENSYLDKNVSDSIRSKQMSKYIRSFFVVLSTYDKIKFNSDINLYIKEFREKINYRLNISILIKMLRNEPKDFLKIVLFKARLYKILSILLRGQ